MIQSIQINEHGLVRYVDHMGTDFSITQAARVSYSGLETKKLSNDTILLRYLMRHKHFSPFAMATVKLHLVLPIYIHRQFIRHDRFHWNEMSGRYSVMPTDQIWQPEVEDFRMQSKTNKQVGEGQLEQESAIQAKIIFDNSVSQTVAAYSELIDLGVCREQARGVLPLSQYTSAYATATLGDWLALLKLRLAPDAQKEIRDYASAIMEIIEKLFPETIASFKDYQLNSIDFTVYDLEMLALLLCEPESMTYDKFFYRFDHLEKPSEFRGGPREWSEFKTKMYMFLSKQNPFEVF